MTANTSSAVMQQRSEPLFDVIISDPPWRFTNNSVAKPGRNAMRHYPCMTDAELCALPIPAAKDAILLLWTTAPMLVRSLKVMDAWGFKYVSQLVWAKGRIGTGFWARNRHEILLICKRGKFPCPKPALFPDSIIPGVQREHSRKPTWLHEVIEDRLPDARKLEMFARSERTGWTCWGNETDKFAEAA